jgi:hypothetical protein
MAVPEPVLGLLSGSPPSEKLLVPEMFYLFLSLLSFSPEPRCLFQPLFCSSHRWRVRFRYRKRLPDRHHCLL